MSILDDIAKAKIAATERWVAEGARGSLHMAQVLAAEDAVIADLDRLMESGLLPDGRATREDADPPDASSGT